MSDLIIELLHLFHICLRFREAIIPSLQGISFIATWTSAPRLPQTEVASDFIVTLKTRWSWWWPRWWPWWWLPWWLWWTSAPRLPQTGLAPFSSSHSNHDDHDYDDDHDSDLDDDDPDDDLNDDHDDLRTQIATDWGVSIFIIMLKFVSNQSRKGKVIQIPDIRAQSVSKISKGDRFLVWSWRSVKSYWFLSFVLPSMYLYRFWFPTMYKPWGCFLVQFGWKKWFIQKSTLRWGFFGHGAGSTDFRGG